MEITINQGDKFAMQLTITNKEGEPIVLDGLSFIFAGKYNPMKKDTLAFVGKCEVVGPGLLKCTIDHEQTGKFKNHAIFGQFNKVYWDIWCVEKQLRILSGEANISTGISYRKEGK